MEGELDRMCDEANREWLRARVVADAAMLASTGSVADSHADSPRDSHAARPDSHTPGAWPEPYDPAGDSDSDSGSLNAGLDRLGDHHQGPGGFGRVDTAQRLDRARGPMPSGGREPVRGADREAAVTTVSIAPNGRLIGLFSDDPGLVDEINEEISDMVLPVTPRTERGARLAIRECAGFMCAHSDCYIAEPHSHDTSTCEPLSSIPDLIEMIRRERDELRVRVKTLEDTIARMKRGYE